MSAPSKASKSTSRKPAKKPSRPRPTREEPLEAAVDDDREIRLEPAATAPEGATALELMMKPFAEIDTMKLMVFVRRLQRAPGRVFDLLELLFEPASIEMLEDAMLNDTITGLELSQASLLATERLAARPI